MRPRRSSREIPDEDYAEKNITDDDADFDTVTNNHSKSASDEILPNMPRSKTGSKRASDEPLQGAIAKKSKKEKVLVPAATAGLATKVATQVSSLGLDRVNIDIKLDETKTIIISFLKLVNDHGLRVKPGSRHERTTVYDNIFTHILDLSLYDSAKRFYELIEDDVVLYDNELDDGSTSRCWCVPVYNVRDSHPQPIDLFVVPVTHGGSNLITEELCKDRDMAIELGRITAHIMNRIPEKLPLYSRNGLTTVSRPVARQIILPREWASVNSESLLLQIEVQFNSESS